MRRAFGTRGPGPAVCFTVAAETLNVKARFADVAIEYSEPTDGGDETLQLAADHAAVEQERVQRQPREAEAQAVTTDAIIKKVFNAVPVP